MKTEGFEVEMDRVGDAQVVSAKLTAEQAPGEIDDVVAGRRPLRKLFSADQERLITEFGPAAVGWDDLQLMGPIAVQKWKVEAKDLEHEVVMRALEAAGWLGPRGALRSRSSPVRPRRPRTFIDYLEAHGIEVGGDQQTKTRGALTFFTHRPGLRRLIGGSVRRGRGTPTQLTIATHHGFDRRRRGGRPRCMPGRGLHDSAGLRERARR